MKTKQIILSVMLSTILFSCSSLDEQVSERSNLPTWILNPTIEGAIAAVDCVIYSGNLSVDRKMATANSRVTLAQMLSLNIDILDNTLLDRTDNSTTESTFRTVSKQLTQRTLRGTTVAKADFVEIKDVEHFCVLSTINPKATNKLFNEIIKSSKRQLTAENEKLLRQEFKAFKANKSLEEELTKLRG
jgi:hypothetical protein